MAKLNLCPCVYCSWYYRIWAIIRIVLCIHIHPTYLWTFESSLREAPLHWVNSMSLVLLAADFFGFLFKIFFPVSYIRNFFTGSAIWHSSNDFVRIAEWSFDIHFSLNNFLMLKCFPGDTLLNNHSQMFLVFALFFLHLIFPAWSSFTPQSPEYETSWHLNSSSKADSNSSVCL